MQAIAFLQELEKMHNSVILLNDIVRIINKNKEYARVYIHRLSKKNLIHEIERGKYTLSNDPFEIASNLIFPGYISFISAYSIYGFTTQIPANIQIVSLKSKKPLSVYNTRISFIKFKRENFFGYKRKNFREKYIFIAEPEKAIIDSLYLPEYCPITESFEALKNKEINIDKLIDYALKMGSHVALKRLGYLLELNGIDIFEKIKQKLNQRYDLLNPALRKSKKNSSKWKLNINEVFE